MFVRSNRFEDLLPSRLSPDPLGSLISSPPCGKVTHVEPREAFKVWLRFDEHVEGEVDLSDLAGQGVCSAWADRAFFESVSLGPDRGITWPGELDLCADSLYFDLTGKLLGETGGVQQRCVCLS